MFVAGGLSGCASAHGSSPPGAVVRHYPPSSCARALVSRARTVPVQLLPSAHGWGSLQLFYTHLLIIMMLGTPDLTLMSNGAYHGV
jgi:hypothetical protein